MAAPVVPPTTTIAEQKKFMMPDLKPCPRATALPPISAYDDLVSVVVGEGKEVFRIYRGVLTYHSSHFAAALNGSFKESETGVVALGEEDVEVFKAFYSWIYNRRLRDTPAPSHNDNSGEAEKMAVTAWEELLCKIFVFADMRGVLALKNDAIDALHESISCSWMSIEGNNVQYIYNNTVETSQLRRFAVQDVVLGSNSLRSLLESFQKEIRKYPMDFVIEILQDLASRNESGAWPDVDDLRTNWAKLDTCQFHDHSGPGGALRRSPASRSALEAMDTST